MAGSVKLLLLADGRFPSGGYAHAAGVEEAVRQGLVRDLAEAAAYLDGVVATTGTSAACLAAVAWGLESQGALEPTWRRLDQEADARMAGSAARAASRLLGRHLARAAAALGPYGQAAATRAAGGHPEGPHHCLALGAVVAASGGGVEDAGQLAVLSVATSVVHGAVRLLGLDPVAATGVVVARADWLAEVARDAACLASRALDCWPTGLEALPAVAGVLLDHLLECQLARPDRLFAS
jgi:urease accessory protein